MQIQRKKLTKKYFMTVKPFMFLVSNCCSAPFLPIFAESIEIEEAKREAQWQRIIDSGAAQRLCNVFITKQQWLNFVDQFGSVARS
jgi:hypothetical protein